MLIADMTTKLAYKVALPWSLTHYMVLNGFHPLYRALLEEAPDNLSFCAWDNVKLYHRFQDDAKSRKMTLSECRKYQMQWRAIQDPIQKAHVDYFWPPNQVLTEYLEGDIELHHTAPFPSLTRPFVFHCEMFDSIFLSFIISGMNDFDACKEYLRSIFSHPYCIGISSHIPETLENFRTFFSDAGIDQKLFLSKMGLSSHTFKQEKGGHHKDRIEAPQFLFVNSASQESKGFFRRGGHIVLRFWKEWIKSGRKEVLTLRCCKPSDQDLMQFNVDPVFVKAELGSSIRWIEDFVPNDALRDLMGRAHFFLLPSEMLHSVSIMQAMSFGTIPVVTDTIGTSLYVPNEQYGIILKGVRKAWWRHDTNSGILKSRSYGSSSFDKNLSDSLTQQLCEGVLRIVDHPERYQRMQEDISLYAKQNFSGVNFSRHFWSTVASLYDNFLNCRTDRAKDSSLAMQTVKNAQTICLGKLTQALSNCQLDPENWGRVFESTTQPHVKNRTLFSMIVEMGGVFMHVPRSYLMKVNNWSVFAHYYSFRSAPMKFAYSQTDDSMKSSFFWIQRNGRRSISLSSVFSICCSFGIAILKKAKVVR
jgi:glycosyltransferase involved in cell wall biosynthesis